MNNNKFKHIIASLNPSYFALVMATGIISIACRQLHFTTMAKALFWLNNVQYVILFLLLLARLIFFFPAIKADLSNHAKGAGFLTFVAGSCILGTGYIQGQQAFTIGTFLWIMSLVAWVVLVYSFLALVMLKKEKPSPEKGLNGSWLLLVVSTQSLVILGATLWPYLQVPTHIVLFALLSAWLVGLILYIVLLTLILYRLFFFPLKAAEISPSDWIDTGAVAISCLAGLTIADALTAVTGMASYIPIIHLLCTLLWAMATFWLPLLVILEVWRHIKAGFTYSPGYWSMVFPLGMYTVATLKISTSLQLSFLKSISQVFIYVALIVWLLIFISMLNNLFSIRPVDK